MGVQYVLICRRVRPEPSQPHLGRVWLWPFGNQMQTDFMTDNAWAFSTYLSAAERNQTRASRIWVGFGSGLSATRRRQISTDRQRMNVQYMLICRRV